MVSEHATLKKFWSKVDTSGGVDACWPWQGRKNWCGYGVININKRPTMAHRITCAMRHGNAPAPKSMAMHSCDNPSCCNPAHLSWGDNTLNIRDARSKGRLANQILMPSQVAYIKLLLQHGLNQKLIGSWYGVGNKCISMISTGLSWNGVDPYPFINPFGETA